MDFNPELCRNESEVESKFLVQYLLPKLGYPADAWYQEVALGKIRLDFMVLAARTMLMGDPSIRLVLEAKHPNRNLDRHVLRLRTYLQTLGTRYGVLTNGKEFRVYELQGKQLSLVFRCQGHEVESHILTLRALIGNENGLVTTVEPIPQEEAVKKKGIPMQTIAVYHNKGGVGKTTTIINLAAALSKQGYRVLLIDLDAQANTTYATGLVRFEDEEQDDIRDRNIYHVLKSDEFSPIEEIARKSRFCTPEIDVIPSHINLMQAEVELNAFDACRLTLINKLKAVEDRYDFVLIDTPPSLNLYARIALIAADHLIIPSDLKPFANQGLLNILDFIKGVNDFRKLIQRRPINLLGILPSKISTNPKFINSTLAKRKHNVEARYGIPLFQSQIFERDDLAKCTENIYRNGEQEYPMPLSVLDFNPDCASAEEFEALAKEVLSKVATRVEEAVR